MIRIIKDKQELETKIKKLIIEFLDKHEQTGIHIDIETNLNYEHLQTKAHYLIGVNVNVIITI